MFLSILINACLVILSDFSLRFCVSPFLRLVSSIHAIMATTAGVIIVASCRGNVIDDRLDFMSLIVFVKVWQHISRSVFTPAPVGASDSDENQGGTSLSVCNYSAYTGDVIG